MMPVTMANKNRTEPLSVSVRFAKEEVALDLRDRRPDRIALFGDLDEPARDQLAHDAWAIGLRALSKAHQAARESEINDVWTALLGDIDRPLEVLVERHQPTGGVVLTRSFDPFTGTSPAAAPHEGFPRTSSRETVPTKNFRISLVTRVPPESEE